MRMPTVMHEVSGQFRIVPHIPLYCFSNADKKRDEERNARIDAAVGSEEPLNEIERALGQSLEQHDWTYNYSDCGDTWRRGQNHRDELERGLLALPAERARIVWKAFVHPYYEQYWKCPI